MMKIAKWNEYTQQPIDIRYAHTLKAGNGVPLRDWSSRHQRGYYEYVPVELAEGEGLDNETHSKPDNVIMQHGTVVSAAEMQSRAQAAREQEAAEMVNEYGADVAILGAQLAKFTDPETGLPYEMPIDAGKVIAEVKTGLGTGAIPNTMIEAAKTLEELYKDLRQVMTDADIAAVASYLGGEQ